MRTIVDIYQAYNTMPMLQRHQLRVAAVASQICDSMKVSVHKEDVIRACLIHDMGNIVKFDLTYFKERLKPHGIEYWERVQKEYREKYGINDHTANLTIAREIGVSDEITSYIDAIGFQFWCQTYESDEWEKKICAYADTRVSPFGVVSVEERLIEGSKRYAGKNPALDAQRTTFHDCIRQMERDIFSHSTIKPEDITDQSIEQYMDTLKNFKF